MASLYGSIPGEYEEDEEIYILPKRKKQDKRWSVMEKLGSRHYCRIRTVGDCMRILNFKCVLATGMLLVCLVLLYSFITVLFSFRGGNNNFDYIIVGAGPAGSLVARRLVDMGATVLLVEAGEETQYALGGTDVVGGHLTRFDIPLMWPIASQSTDYRWPTMPSMPHVTLAKGLGGCGIHNAMIYVRAIEQDIIGWNISGWDWNTVLSKYMKLERFRGYPDAVIEPIQHPVHASSASTTQNSMASVPFHGLKGVLDNQYVPPDSLSSMFVSAAMKQGIPYSADFNAPSGLSDIQVTDIDPTSSDNSIGATLESYWSHHYHRVSSGTSVSLPVGRMGVGYHTFNIVNGTRQSVASAMLPSILPSPTPETRSPNGNQNAEMHVHEAKEEKTKTNERTSKDSSAQMLSGSIVESLCTKLFYMADLLYIVASGDTSRATGRRLGSSSQPPPGTLSVLKKTMVRRILFDPESNVFGTKHHQKKAIGIEYETSAAASEKYIKKYAKQNSGGGVEHGKELHTVFLKKSGAVDNSIISNFRSIIVTAGTINTPKVLMNSGIGPKQMLKKTGIEVLVDAPLVGKNLQDHPVISMVFQINRRLISYDIPSLFSFPTAFKRYACNVESLSNKDTSKMKLHPEAHRLFDETDCLTDMEARDEDPFGALGSPGFSAGAFIRSPYAIDDASSSGPDVDNVPDIQLTFFPNIIEPTVWMSAKRKHAGRYHKEPDSCPFDETNNIMVTIALLSPEGRYEVVLDPLSPIQSMPIIQVPVEKSKGKNPKYLTERDVARLAWAVDQVRNIFGVGTPLQEDDKPMPAKTLEKSIERKHFNSSKSSYRLSSSTDKLTLPDIVECEVSPGKNIESFESLKTWIHSNHFPNSHWVGTAKMGNGIILDGEDKYDGDSHNATSVNATGGSRRLTGRPSSPVDVEVKDDTHESVVDHRLRVLGTSNVYVADASVIPIIPNGNVHSTVTIVAEMAAGFLQREQYGLLDSIL